MVFSLLLTHVIGKNVGRDCHHRRRRKVTLARPTRRMRRATTATADYTRASWALQLVTGTTVSVWRAQWRTVNPGIVVARHHRHFGARDSAVTVVANHGSH